MSKGESKALEGRGFRHVIRRGLRNVLDFFLLVLEGFLS